MKRTIFIIALFAWQLPSFAQVLTIDETIKLLNKEVSEIHDYLMAKSWNFQSSESETDSTYGFVTWYHGYDEYTDQMTAQLRTKMYLNKSVEVQYRFANAEVYKSLLAKANAYQMQKVNTWFADNAIIATYKGKNYGFLIATAKNENSTYYDFMIMSKASFEKRFETID